LLFAIAKIYYGNMFGYQSSIRQKITFGYYVGVIVIIGISLFTLIELWYIEKKVRFGEVVAEFFDTTLELRRFEKNFFLYRQSEDYQENLQYIDKAIDILDKNVSGYKNLAVSSQLDKLRDDLKQYRLLMRQFALLEKRAHDTRLVLAENAVREKGKDIITIAESISRTERQKIQHLLDTIQKFIIISIFCFSIGGITIGQILSRMIVKPLKSLEAMMKEISEGKMKTVNILSKDREIVSLTSAFNKMLMELDLRQRHLIQREKLASLGTLVSGVAHELNNPLSNISSSCQILIEELEDADIEFKKDLLSQIDEQTDRAKYIVRSLLEFSRDKEFKRQDLPLKRLFEETMQFLKGHVPSGITVSLDIPDDLTVFVDKQRIQQAFLNLMKNALDSLETEGSVFIKARRHILKGTIDERCEYQKNQGQCTGECPIKTDTIDIEIKDTGSGIPPEVLPKIFDPFFTTKDVGKGSGLGLYIVQEIVHEHNACIGACSELGKGTTFVIRFPIKE
jgi:two-component system, NtrC family, sensor kinase